MFIRFTGPKLIDESREAVAKILNAPTDSVVLVCLLHLHPSSPYISFPP